MATTAYFRVDDDRFRGQVAMDELGALVTLEMGKILTEGVGEVQEFIDIVSCLFSMRVLAMTAVTGGLRRRSIAHDERARYFIRAARPYDSRRCVSSLTLRNKMLRCPGPL